VSSGCKAFKDALVAALDAAGLTKRTLVKLTGCMGTCAVGPTMIVQPGGIFYCNLKPENAATIVERHLKGGEVVTELCYLDRNTGRRVPRLEDIESISRPSSKSS
jgi:(2Fe-2S) ferredoxin